MIRSVSQSFIIKTDLSVFRKIPLLITLFLIPSWFIFSRPLFLGGPATYIIVSGISMEPTLFTGDLAMLQSKESYAIGDIIAFHVSGGNVIHRIVGGTAEEGFLTQGDNKKSVDPWQPKPDEILGKMWFHIPMAGKYMQNLRSPISLAALAGLGMLLFIEEPGKDKQKRNRGKRMRSGGKGNLGNANNSESLLSPLGIFAFLTLVFLAGTIYSYRQPLKVTETITQTLYDKTVLFDYSIHTVPSILYPDQIVTSNQLSVDEVTGTMEIQPVLTQLARSLALDIEYELVSAFAVNVSGEISAIMEIRAGEVWKKTSELLPPTPFTGPGTSIPLSLDFDQVHAFITAVEEETDYHPGNYDIAIIPTIHIYGTVGNQSIDDTYSPDFSLVFNQTTIKPVSELSYTESKNLDQPVLRPNEVKFLNWSFPVDSLRRVSLTGFILSFVITLGLGSFVAYLLIKDQNTFLKIRYGSPVISVKEAELNRGRRIQVASMNDLARLARRDGNIIFHLSDCDGQTFFVPDGQLTYTYQVKETNPPDR